MSEHHKRNVLTKNHYLRMSYLEALLSEHSKGEKQQSQQQFNKAVKKAIDAKKVQAVAAAREKARKAVQDLARSRQDLLKDVRAQSGGGVIRAAKKSRQFKALIDQGSVPDFEDRRQLLAGFLPREQEVAREKAAVLKSNASTKGDGMYYGIGKYYRRKKAYVKKPVKKRRYKKKKNPYHEALRKAYAEIIASRVPPMEMDPIDQLIVKFEKKRSAASGISPPRKFKLEDELLGLI